MCDTVVSAVLADVRLYHQNSCINQKMSFFRQSAVWHRCLKGLKISFPLKMFVVIQRKGRREGQVCLVWTRTCVNVNFSPPPSRSIFTSNKLFSLSLAPDCKLCREYWKQEWNGTIVKWFSHHWSHAHMHSYSFSLTGFYKQFEASLWSCLSWILISREEHEADAFPESLFAHVHLQVTDLLLVTWRKREPSRQQRLQTADSEFNAAELLFAADVLFVKQTVIRL